MLRVNLPNTNYIIKIFIGFFLFWLFSVITNGQNAKSNYFQSEKYNTSELIIDCTPDTTTFLDTTVCDKKFPFQWNEKIISNEGTYKDTLVNILGCDSIVTLVVVSFSSETLVFNSLQTVFCENGVMDLPTTSDNGIDGLWFGDFGSIQDFFDYPAGTYYFTFVPSDMCSDSVTTEVIIVPSIAIASNVTNVSVKGLSDGSITIDIINPDDFEGLSFNWSNGDTTKDISELSEGFYSLQIINPNGCDFYESFEISYDSTGSFYMTCPPTALLDCNYEINSYPNLVEFYNWGGTVHSYPFTILDSTFSFIDYYIQSNYCLSIEREYLIYNSNNQGAFCTQTIIVNDTYPPEIYPSNIIDTVITLDSLPKIIENIEELSSLGVWLDDNCEIVAFYLESEIVDTTQSVVSIERTYHAEDYCGNLSLFTHTILITHITSSNGLVNESNLSLEVYPNPSRGKLYVKIESGSVKKYQLQLLNNLGQEQFIKEIETWNSIHEEKINISNLPKGNYFIKVFNEENSQVKKVVLQ